MFIVRQPRLTVHVAILTTAHAQLTCGRHGFLGPKINDSLGHVDRDIPCSKATHKDSHIIHNINGRVQPQPL